jgi:tetratricopeptide (TPR) repeat protein
VARIRFTTYLSYALTDLGDLKRAEEVLDDVLGSAEELPDAYSRVRLYWSVARLNEARGRPAAALDYIRRAIALLDVTDDTLHLARAHLLCGTIMLSQGQADEAGKHQDLAERLLGPSAEPADLSGLYADQARRAIALEDAETAVGKGEAAVAAVEGDEYPHEKGRGLWALADARMLAGDPDGADQAFGEAVLLLEAHGQRREYVDAYRAWGKFLRRVGREQDALEVLERATDLAAEPLADAQAHQAQA